MGIEAFLIRMRWKEMEGKEINFNNKYLEFHKITETSGKQWN